MTDNLEYFPSNDHVHVWNSERQWYILTVTLTDALMSAIEHNRQYVHRSTKSEDGQYFAQTVWENPWYEEVQRYTMVP
jgi:hypothetical protein